MPTAVWKSRLRSGSAHCDLEVAVEVRQCPCTGIWSSGLRSGSAHCDLEVAVEVRQCPLGSVRLCPLGSGLRGGGRGGGGGCGGGRRRRTALIKSNNPHLAGGEKIFFQFSWNESFSSTFGVSSK